MCEIQYPGSGKTIVQAKRKDNENKFIIEAECVYINETDSNSTVTLNILGASAAPAPIDISNRHLAHVWFTTPGWSKYLRRVLGITTVGS